ncbi:MAG: glucose-6-phosphate isomerase [Verrucomicrobiota bacterium]
MKLSSQSLWTRFQTYCSSFPSLDLQLDLSRMNFPDDFFSTIAPLLNKAFDDMAKLEQGAIANPDEGRMVGHYWLRNPSLAPSPELKNEIEETQRHIGEFARQIHAGEILLSNNKCQYLLVIGIGGSALGPEFVAHALGQPHSDPVQTYFFDNTDPDGFDRVLAFLQPRLSSTLCVVISKSGGTKETRNGMLEAEAAFKRANLRFAAHAVAITGRNSELDKLAERENWLRRFPMWDWVGGRTSETSAVGLLPAALQGIDTRSLLKGAAECDKVTRVADVHKNPAAQLAAMWYYAGSGRGTKDMVVLPYKDRLELFSRYLQQLVMESLGKEKDLQGNVVNQGLAVYGNKGSTDQHAYIQQLRDGLPNFFVTFIRVLKDRDAKSFMVEPNTTSGDYLDGFFLGTRKALFENGRESITLTIGNVNPFSVGVLIALYERAVGFYASMVGINAYHQPGVEAGKKAAGQVLEIQSRILGFLDGQVGRAFGVSELTAGIGCDDPETVFHVLEHLAANTDRGIVKATGKTPFESTYRKG